MPKLKTLIRATLTVTTSLCSAATGTLSADDQVVAVHYDLAAKRYLNGTSELQREKFFNIHANYISNGHTVADLQWLESMGVGYGRVFNGPFWNFRPKADSPFPTDAQAQELSRAQRDRRQSHPLYPFHSRRVIITDHPSDAFHTEIDPKAAAQWAVSHFRHFYSDQDRPLFYEPMNEPFVHTDKFGTDHEAIRAQMTDLFREIGKAFDESELDVEVYGYASAWPSMELWDFGHWNGRMKRFMDDAGDYMDGFSVHLYDGTNVTGQDNRRSGSNAEAILDMVETYSHSKWGIVKPHLLSEYGDIVEGFPAEYSDEKAAQELRSYNHLLFTLLERQDRIRHSVPFITSKSPWFYNVPANKTTSSLMGPTSGAQKGALLKMAALTPSKPLPRHSSTSSGKTLQAHAPKPTQRALTCASRHLLTKRPHISA